MTYTQMTVPVAALGLAQRVTREATSPTGTADESPCDHAQRHASRHRSGGADLRVALDRVRRQRGA
jgi:hypothetical protein